jgi:PKD repeat protein
MPTTHDRERALSELVGTILVIILVIAIAGIIAALVFGWSIPLQRTPYFVSEATAIDNASVVRLSHAQGDPVSLYPGATQGLPMKMTLAKGGVTYDATPLPSAAARGWKSGETLYIFRNATGVWITDSPAHIQNSTGFSTGPWRLSLVDITSNVLIVQHTLDLAGDGNGLVADFSAEPVSGTAPLTVNFTDHSAGNPLSWAWTFGDASTSVLQHPSHTYTTHGTYTVTLTVSYPGGITTITKTDYIEVVPGTEGFTAEAWVKWNKNPAPTADDQRWATIVVDGDRDSNSRYHLQHNQDNSRFEFAIRTSDNTRTWRVSTTSPMTGTRYYVAGVYNRETGQLLVYVNGNLENGATVSTGGLIASPNRYQVGGPAGIQWPTSRLRKFDGEIRGLGTHERAFTPDEIQARYNAGPP